MVFCSIRGAGGALIAARSSQGVATAGEQHQTRQGSCEGAKDGHADHGSGVRWLNRMGPFAVCS